MELIKTLDHEEIPKRKLSFIGRTALAVSRYLEKVAASRSEISRGIEIHSYVSQAEEDSNVTYI